MRFISFTSGSCGNCCYLGPDAGTSGGGILIDAGASMRRVAKMMAAEGLSLDEVAAVLVTHDHLDHIRFLGTYCKYRRIPVCAPKRLHGALSVHPFTRDHIASCRMVLGDGQWNDLGCGFKVQHFEVPHDATQTVGYAVICPDGHKFTLMTDMEHVTPQAMAFARDSDTVVIESNYDYDMLVGGPYPPQLQQRILEEGHLSNEACARAIRQLWHPGLKNLFLCHLSGNNNTPQLAWDSAAQALRSIGVEPADVRLRVLHRGVPSPLLTL